ncbi:MAG: hypothetical protein LQ351_002188 [Letrouitia transgressa]|nr:MAG: hypothetical protein LQ351_002188 [Letrouitia transgressa]
MERTRGNGRNETGNESTARTQNPQLQQNNARRWNVAMRIGYPVPGAQGIGGINVNPMQLQPSVHHRAVGFGTYLGPYAQGNGNNNANPIQYQQQQQRTNNMMGGQFPHPPPSPQGSLSPRLNLASFEPREPPLLNRRQPQNTSGTSNIPRPTGLTTPTRRVRDRRSSSPVEASPDSQSTREREMFTPSSRRHRPAQHSNPGAGAGASALGSPFYPSYLPPPLLGPPILLGNPNLPPNAPPGPTHTTAGVTMTSSQAGLTIRFNGTTLSQFSELPAARQNVAATTLEERPPPLNDEQMTVRVDCKICFTQQATVVVLPCGKSFPGSSIVFVDFLH